MIFALRVVAWVLVGISATGFAWLTIVIVAHRLRRFSR